MSRFEISGRLLRCAACAAGLFCLHAVAATTPTGPKLGAKSRAAKKVVALSPWEQAEQGREALEATPDDGRTKADYTRAIDPYRAIYHGNPRDAHAAAAVNAVAELLAEQGRGLHDPKASKAAVGQYEFLRTQYPTSSLGTQALLAEAEIEQNDLGDATAARERYSLLLKLHPRSPQAEEARAGMASLGAGDREKGVGSREQGVGIRDQRAKAAAVPGVVVMPAAVGSSLPAMATTAGVVGAAQPTLRDGAAKDGPPGLVAGVVAGPAAVGTDARRRGEKAQVTGIRHWSTATYTRVAIDLGDNVTYEAARVPNPDRIYFDLHGTRLAQELVGKSFAVTDDGFLKKIRAAQFSDDMTRVVLDVNDVTEYSAFLLPNPYRLIIDIHGGKEQGTGNREQGVASKDATAATLPVEAPAPRVAATVRPTAAKPVPNTVTSKNTSTDVADLSLLPGRVEATSKPTSKPIAATVPGMKLQVAEAEAKQAKAIPVATLTPSAMPTPVATLTPVDLSATALPSSALTPDSVKKTRKPAKLTPAEPARAAVPTADGETSLVRALGLKIGRIVIDAGHGGHDSGTLGVDGIQEKDVVLDVALRVGKLLHDRLGAEIIYTRSDDTFIPLETRTAIANKAQADLFLSIHANSSSDETARGVETYYLNFTSDPTALDVAARENAVSDQSIHQLSDLVKKIALKDKIAESREFAADVEQSLYGGLQAGNAGLKNRGVKKAPFVVLIGANMPSILAEISFVTNAKDASQLREPDYRQRVAESLFRGVARYEGGLSGSKITTERAGQ